MLVNVQWATFAIRVSAIFVVAVIAVAVIICCWLREKGQRCSKHRPSQLLSAVTSAIVPGPPSSRSQRVERSEASVSDVSAFEAAKWFRTPSGWASVSGAYLPSPGIMPAQLPFPQFPPTSQDYRMGQQGYPGYPMPGIDFRGREAVQYTRRLEVSHSSSYFVKLSDEPEPVLQRQRVRLSQTPVSTPVPVSASASRSSSCTRFSNVPSGSDSDVGSNRGADEMILRSIRKTPKKKRNTGFYSEE